MDVLDPRRVSAGDDGARAVLDDAFGEGIAETGVSDYGMNASIVCRCQGAR
jgi:hypothetical protein